MQTSARKPTGIHGVTKTQTINEIMLKNRTIFQVLIHFALFPVHISEEPPATEIKITKTRKTASILGFFSSLIMG